MPQQCIILTHNLSKSGASNPNISESMSGIQVVNTSIDEDGETLRNQFTNFIGSLLTTMSDKDSRKNWESSTMNDPDCVLTIRNSVLFCSFSSRTPQCKCTTILNFRYPKFEIGLQIIFTVD